MEYIIVILDAHGNELDCIVSFINPIGAGTITTEKGNFQICESSVDYKLKQIILYSEEYDLYD